MSAEFDWGEPIGYEHKTKKSPFCFRQGGDFYYIILLVFCGGGNIFLDTNLIG